MSQHQIVVNKRVKGEPSGIHFGFDIQSTVELAVVNQAFDENTVGGGRWVYGGIVEELFIMFEGSVRFSAIEVGLEDEVVGDDVGHDAGLGDKAVEGEEIRVAGLAEQGGEDGIDGEDGGAIITFL
ncbi:hypothetical protein RJT34_27923 [Clitoria ternatea]|uniref:Uncharacterized protein n=1 Tax=Clitoria ternatea TaxID=43366 RepID=A0AAN9FAI0_CLITE